MVLVPSHARWSDALVVEHLPGHDDMGFLRVVLVEGHGERERIPPEGRGSRRASVANYGFGSPGLPSFKLATS